MWHNSILDFTIIELKWLMLKKLRSSPSFAFASTRFRCYFFRRKVVSVTQTGNILNIQNIIFCLRLRCQDVSNLMMSCKNGMTSDATNFLVGFSANADKQRKDFLPRKRFFLRTFICIYKNFHTQFKRWKKK